MVRGTRKAAAASPPTTKTTTKTTSAPSPPDHQPQIDEQQAWFPGKHISDAKSAARRRAQEATRAADEGLLARADSQHDPLQVQVGELRCAVVAVERLPGTHDHAPYCRVWFEGVAKDTNRAPTPKPSGSRVAFSETQSEFTFCVTDVAADVVFAVYAQREALSLLVNPHVDDLVGKAVLPLSRLLGLARIASPTMETWLDLLPLKPEQTTYSALVEGLPVSGLPRPPAFLGRVLVRVELNLAVSVPEALVFVPPFRNLAPAIPTKPINPRAVRDGQLRLASALKAVRGGAPLRYLLDWGEPLASLVCVAVGFTALLACPVYQLPLVVTSSFVAGTRWWSARPPMQQVRDHAPKLFADETTLSPDVPVTLPQKLKQLVKLAGTLQRVVNGAASGVERAMYAWSWEDENVSLLVSLVALAAAVGFSLVLMALEWVFTHVASARVVLAVGWGLLWAKSAWRRFRSRGASLSSGESGASTSTSSSSVAELDAQDDDDEDDEGESVERQIDKAHTTTTDASAVVNEHRDRAKQVHDVAWFYDARNVRDAAGQALRNLAARIPDQREIYHRRIARSRASVSLPYE